MQDGRKIPRESAQRQCSSEIDQLDASCKYGDQDFQGTRKQTPKVAHAVSELESTDESFHISGFDGT